MLVPRVLGAVATAGCACVAYGALYERTAFTLRRFDVPVLARGSAPLRILHVADQHLTPGQHEKQQWIRDLAHLEPDLVISTGDNLAHRDAVGVVLESFGPLLDFPGVFVFGSNDYFAPEARNPLRYLTGGTGTTTAPAEPNLPWRALRSALTDHGWRDLNNKRDELIVDGRRIDFVGVDDPHRGYDQLDDISANGEADLSIGVAHAPYLRVLDRWNELGYQLLIAGHTHGGQLCVPGFGALVTNCDLEPSRAKGLHRHAASGRTPSWLHVSAGLGTNPYAPIRFACRPEASLLTLTAIDSPGS